MASEELFKRLLSELQASSPKAAAAAIDVLPEVRAVLREEALVAWLDLVVSMSGQSGAAALKFCQESAGIFQTMEDAQVKPALAMALELAEQDANVALEAVRQARGVSGVAGVEALSEWSGIGADLAKLDYVLGIEFLRRGPHILAVLPPEDLKAWASISVKLVTTNSLGKPDYMAALAFFRSSAMLLGDLATPGVRRQALALAGVLAGRAPAQAIEFLGAIAGWLRPLADPSWQERVLQYGMPVAEQDPEAALAYLRRAPEVLVLTIPSSEAVVGAGGVWEQFEKWFRAGMDVLAYNPEAARAYFAVETRTALAAIEEAASGVALRGIARMLKLFAEALSGQPVTIRPMDDDDTAPSTRWSSDGAVISLPARLRREASRADNVRLYKLLTAHEAGHLEYGTYALQMARLEDLAAQASVRYGRARSSPPASLDELFRLYPQPLLMRDLWMMAEDARVEACLKAEYPGLRRDMEVAAREAIARRSLTHGMSIREMVIEVLLQMSAGQPEEVRVPVALEEVVERAWAQLQAVAQPQATAEDVVRAVHRAYVLIEELTAEEVAAPEGAAEDSEPAVEPHPGEEQGGPYRPMAPLAYRGAMEAERIRDTSEGETEPAASSVHDHDAQVEPALADGAKPKQGPRILHDVAASPAGSSGTSLREELEAAEPAAGHALAVTPGMNAFLYDEWDGRIQDYRIRWCRVLEQAAPEGTDAFLERTRSRYGGVVSLIRRYFEGIRPPALRRVRRQADGEEVDLDAAVEALVEARAQASASEFVYVRRDRRDRNVAAVFLIDLSGSTGQQIGPGGTRIIDVEKEGLVLLCEALEAIGDQYAVYGYSGRSRHEVQLFVLKDFDERYGPQVWRRIDALRPLVQNRDGAAIRHALRRLAERDARVKLMIVLSDGRPLDDAYQDEYALEDTKAALREAKALGVHPFCVTVDREARGYLERMYGEVCYLIIDRVETLPERLPRLYKALTT